MRKRPSPPTIAPHRALSLLALTLACILVPRSAHAQLCNQTQWLQLTLGGHAGPHVLYHPGLSKLIRLDPSPWEWTGQTWRPMPHAVSPDDLYHAPPALAYDPIHNHVVALASGPIRTRVWDTNTWTDLPSAPTPFRSNYALAFDPHLAGVIMVGGFYNQALLGDMWAWNGTSWSLISANALPPRDGHSMLFDPVSGKLLLHGGRTTPNGPPSPETWAWDGSTWTLLASDGPAETTPAHMAFDEVLGRVVMLYPQTQAGPAELWEWTGTRWLSRGPQSLPARADVGAAYDPHTQRLVVSGGRPTTLSNTMYPETWELGPAGWNLAWNEHGLARSGNALAYDAARDLVISFGGVADPANHMLAFDGSTWTPINAPGPAPRRAPAMAYDESRSVVVLHGGSTLDYQTALRDTWEWNGTTWTQIAANGPFGYSQALVYDSLRERCLLVNGLGELWSWSGKSWELLQTNVPVWNGPNLAFDPVRDLLIVHPATFLNTAAWNGTAWRQYQSYPISWGGPMVFDTVVNRVVRAGGAIYWVPEAGPGNEICETDGFQWDITWQGNPFIPQQRWNHALAWDSLRNRAIMFGGDQSGQTWTYRRIGDTPPIFSHPQSQSVTAGSSVSFNVQTIPFTTHFFQWYFNGQPLQQGPGPLGNVGYTAAATLTITNVTSAAAGQFHAAISNGCAAATTNPATLFVQCPADLTTNAIPNQPGYATPDGHVTNDDFFFYTAAYARGDLAVADLTTAGAPVPGPPGFGIPDGILSLEDFFAYLYYFSADC